MVFGAAATAPAPDPAITLFGRRICLLESHPDLDPAPERREPDCADDFHDDTETNVFNEITNAAPVSGSDNNDELTREGSAGTLLEDESAVLVPNAYKDDKNNECCISDNATICANSDACSQQKVLKKPDKILPCPRCNSLDTKFCYYNNYNVNQPRYYCKNCERYWTDGGTMRNVPVGAGRRKNKHSAIHCRNSGASSESMTPHGINVSVTPGQMQPSCIPRQESGNSMVLKFQSKEPHPCMETDMPNREEHLKVLQSSLTPSECQKNSSTSVTVTDHTINKPSDDLSKVVQNASTAYAEVASVLSVQCYPGNHWAVLGSPGWNNAAIAAVGCAADMTCGLENVTNNVPWNPNSFVSGSAFVSPTIPFPFIPASFWGCMTSWPTGAWNAPLVGYNGSLSLALPSSLASTRSNEFSGSPSLNMGKRFRDESAQVENKAAASLWFPKTLRIDDPDQAAKSSIWATLGIKHDHSQPITKGTLFKCFQSGTERKIQPPDSSEVLDANPAALSRSQAFKESS